MSSMQRTNEKGNNDYFHQRLSQVEQAVAEGLQQDLSGEKTGYPNETKVRDVYAQVSGAMESEAYLSLTNPARKLRYLADSVQSPVSMGSMPDEPVVIDINKIADIMVLEGSALSLAIDWKDHPVMELEATAEPNPSGKLCLVKNTGYWLFSYTPDENDRFPFRVTLKAISDDDTLSHSFEITPLKKLPAEQAVIGPEQETPSQRTDVNTPQVFVEKIKHTDPNFSFNNMKPESSMKPLELRKVKIIAAELIWDPKNDPYGLYGTYNGARDMESIELFAEKMTVRDQMRFPQTNVTINARELRFEGENARITTTPESLTVTPQDGIAGADGLNAGNIFLNIASFQSAPQDKTRFDLTGGAGQNGGAGANGTDGVSLPEYGFNFSGWVVSSGPGKIPEGYRLVYWELWNRNCFGIPIKDTIKGSADQWPTNGTDAKPNGKPGEGGKGGVLTSTVDALSLATLGGGRSGNVANDPGQPYYFGGRAGNEYSIKYRFDYYACWLTVTELGRHEAKHGNSFKVERAKNSQGAPGSPQRGGNPYTWMNSALIQRLATRIKDDYLDGRIKEAKKDLEFYGRIMREAMKSQSWSSFAADEQNALKNRLDELELLEHRISANLDYFGHPSGWAPLLSFEVNELMFDTEIERSAEILYYTYCIKNKQATAQSQYDSISKFRGQLLTDIDSAREEYEKSLEKITELEVSARNISARISQIQSDLKAKEEELSREAEEQLKDPTWLSAIKIGLKTTGTLLNMLPVGQPATGAVGSALTLVSNIDPEKPWDSIIGGVDIAKTFCSSKYDEKSGEIKKILEKVPQGKEKEYEKLSASKNAYDEAKSACSALSDGLKDMQKYFESQSVSEDELQAVLSGLKEKSPEYQDLLEKSEKMLSDKREFADKLNNAMQSLNRCLNVINDDILAADSLMLDMEKVRAGLNPTVASYVDGMERRAYDRILEYHYYLARAYEYRLLRPYKGNLDFEQIIKDLEKVAQVECWDKLDSETFKSTYRSVFRDKLADIAAEIFKEYSNHPQELSLKLQYALSDEEIGQLNGGWSVKVDFSRLLRNEENLRIVSVGVLCRDDDGRRGYIRTSPKTGSYPTNAYLDLDFTHPGISMIRSDNHVYKYTHKVLDEPNPHVWTARYTPGTDTLDNGGPSEAAESLLKSLLTGEALSGIMIYSRPSAWAEIEITRSEPIEFGKDIVIDELRLELKYDYFKDKRDTADKRILVTTLVPDGHQNLIAHISDMKPYFAIDKQDINSRQDARGEALRIFTLEEKEVVTITAQAKLGGQVFNQWTDMTGTPLAGAYECSATLNLKDTQTICAQYVSGSDATNEVRGMVRPLPNLVEANNTNA
jgi:hypothetical protein